jgi:hypothetical protein
MGYSSLAMSVIKIGAMIRRRPRNCQSWIARAGLKELELKELD